MQKGVTVLGYIMNPDGGSHLHFEVGLSTSQPSTNWSLVGKSSNWAKVKGGYAGYYYNLQQMIDAGMRDPIDFINDNGNSFATLPDGFHDDVNCNEIRGWAMDRNHPDKKVTVEIYDGDTKIASTLADKSRFRN